MTMRNPQKVNLTSSNLSEEKLAELYSILPEAFAENKIDFDKLRTVLGDSIVQGSDKFSFSWAGKSNAIKNVLVPSHLTLNPEPEQSIKWDESENLFIEGDNLEVLKLLQKAYFEKVKMIYIDPPYNTGHDFVYNDDFSAPLDNYLKQTGQKNDDGDSTATNKETNGRYHSDWLSMMYPRLKLAWNLLREDGVIFVSIDDNEVHHLRMVLDEVFGSENFINTLVWEYDNSTLKNPVGKLAKKHEYVLVYGKSDQYKKHWSKIRFGDVSEDLIKRFGKYADEEGNIHLKDVLHENSYLERILPKFKKENGRDAEPEDIVDSLESNYLRDTINIPTTRSLDFYRKYGIWFPNPKPVALIKTLFRLLKHEDGDIVLDFFAGSGTTARAIFELENENEVLNKKFILIQLPEEIDVSSDKKNHQKISDTIAYLEKKGRHGVISQLALDRIGKDIHELNGSGLKMFKLSESNYSENNFVLDPEKSSGENQKEFISYLQKAKQKKLFNKNDHISLVYENIVKEGLSLNSKVAKISIGKNNVYHVVGGDQQLLVCLEDKLAPETVRELTNKTNKDRIFICLESSLDDTTAANLSLNLDLKTI